jgi:Fe-S-cluster containining protein
MNTRGVSMEQDHSNSNENPGKEPSGDKNREPGKYVFQCQCCGQCCEKKEGIVVCIKDLERWGRDLTLPSLFPYLIMELEDEYIQISLRPPESEDREQKRGCPLYDPENKICNIYFSMPLYCKSFPLGYDGNRYFIKDKSCPGIGKGKMSNESLEEARGSARQDFDARVSTALVLPAVHGLALRFLLEQSKKQVDNLSEEQKTQLKDILGQKEEKPDK